MKRTFTKFFSACALTLSSFYLNAQVATLYSFSQFQGTYTPITTGGTVFNTSGFDDQDIVDASGTGIIPDNFVPPAVSGPGVPIGFNFGYNGYVFDRIAISNNGYIVFGNSADGAIAIYESISDWNRPISSTSTGLAKNQQRIAPLGTDLLGQTNSNIRVVTYGTAPTRSCVIQWANYQAYYGTPTGNDNINFQLWLYETSNRIDAIYGTFLSPTLDTVAQVGLRGNSNADFNNRSVSPPTTWTNSVPGLANNYFARYNTGLFPPMGFTYRWEPAQCSGTLATLSTISSSATVCPGVQFNLGLQNTYTVSGISYTWASSNVASTGPYTVIPNSGSAVQNSMAVTVPTWFQVSATCIHSNATTTSTPVFVNALTAPTIAASISSPTICSGLSLTLSATGNYTNHAWNGGYTSGVGFAATTSTSYVVVGTAANGCTASASASVIVTPTPIQPITVSPSVICAGGSATLTAPVASNYTWTSSTQTVFTSSLVVSNLAAGITTYAVVKSNANCVDTKTISVTTNSLPMIAAFASPTLVCALSSATLAVGGALTYTWTSPAPNAYTFTGANPQVSPLVPTTYTVLAHDGTCTALSTVFVNAQPNPTITVSATTSSLCSGKSVTLTAQGGINYTWTPTPGTATLTGPTMTDQPSASTAYNVVGDNASGCTAQASQIVIVYSSPTISVLASKPLICSNTPVTFSASGASTYTWDANANNTVGNTVTVSPVSLSSGYVTYTVNGTSTVGCLGSKTVQVNVFVPVLAVSGSTNACYGGTLGLTASGANSGSYSWSTAIGGNPVNNPVLTTSLTAPEIFTVSASTTSLNITCPVSKTVAVGLYPTPSITAVADRTTICVKETVEIHGEGGVTYTWNTGVSGPTIVVSPQLQTNYTVTGIDQNGCVGTGTIQIRTSGCVGIANNKVSETGISVYPNPNNGEFTIQSSVEMTLLLSNELGQVLRTIQLSGSGDQKIKVADLHAGVYFLTGQKDGTRIHQKIIVAE